jgi:hypothetical protein
MSRFARKLGLHCQQKLLIPLRVLAQPLDFVSSFAHALAERLAGPRVAVSKVA